MANHTKVALAYAAKTGFRIKVRRHLRRTPKLRMLECDIHGVVNGRREWVAVSYVAGRVPDDVKAAVVWHELGHVDQFAACPWGETKEWTTNLSIWYEEVDAWERGLILADQHGYRITPRAASFALEALLTYAPFPKNPTMRDEWAVNYIVSNDALVRYLMAIAGGR